MKRINNSLAFLLILVVLLVVACEKHNTTGNDPEYNPPNEEINPLDLTPRENAEAEEAALWLSNEIVTPQDLYEKVLSGFNLLREKYADSIPEVNIPFKLPFNSSRIYFKMSDSAITAIRAGNYDAWDSLNAYYDYSNLDTSLYAWGAFYVHLIFEGRFNTYKLCEMYEELPGVIWVSSGGYVGDWSCTYPWLDSTGNLTFLVRKAWGDCPAGCINSHFYYFKMQASDLKYIGNFEASYPPIVPDWWEEAKVAYETYRYYPNDPK